MKTIAIIPAAGLGLRMGGPLPKQYLSIGGETILHWTLKHLSESGLIDGICLVVNEAYTSGVTGPVGERPSAGLPPTLQVGFTAEGSASPPPVTSLVHWIVSGGKERQESVAKGFAAIPPCEIVLVHDGVRPFVSKKLIQNLIEAARRDGGAVPGVPVKETVKEVGNRVILRTVDRSHLCTVQTPQAFRYELLKEGLNKAAQDGFIGTDESMLVERLGKRVSVVNGTAMNIKITRPEDLILAEGILHADWNRL